MGPALRAGRASRAISETNLRLRRHSYLRFLQSLIPHIGEVDQSQSPSHFSQGAISSRWLRRVASMSAILFT
jgi:hypothetical protein